MDKKIKIGLGVIAASTLLATGGMLYTIISDIKTNEEAFLGSIARISEHLPKADSLSSATTKIEVTHIPGENGFLSRNGTYLINYINETDNSLNANISLKYNAKLTLLSLAYRNLDATMEGVIEGNIINTYQIKTNDKPNIVFKLSRSHVNDGDFSFVGTPEKFSFVIPKYDVEMDKNLQSAINDNNQNKVTEKQSLTGMLTTLQNNFFTLYYRTAGDYISLNYHVDDLKAYDLEEPQDRAEIKDFAVGCFTHLSNMDSTQLKAKYSNKVDDVELAIDGCHLDADKISDGTEAFKAENFHINGRIYKYNNKYDVSFNSSAQNINMLSLKDFSYDVKYDVKGINNKMVLLYNKVATAVASARELGESDREEAKQILLENMASGFSLDIPKANFSRGKNILNFTGKIELVPTQANQQFSFLTQSKLESNITSKGEFAEMSNALFGAILGSNIVNTQGEDFNFKLNFDRGTLKINDKDAEPKMTEAINDTLKTIDSHLGLGMPEVESDELDEPVEELVELKEQ